jgi:hypothetical protein
LQWYFWQWSSGNFTVALILNLLEHSFWAASRSIAEQYSKSFGDTFPTLKDHFFLTESEQGPLCSLPCGHSLPKHKQEHWFRIFWPKEVVFSYAHQKQPRAQNKEQEHGDLTPW